MLEFISFFYAHHLIPFYCSVIQYREVILRFSQTVFIFTLLKSNTSVLFHLTTYPHSQIIYEKVTTAMS